MDEEAALDAYQEWCEGEGEEVTAPDEAARMIWLAAWGAREEDVRFYHEAAVAAQRRMEGLEAERARLREALAFAASVIKSGESWTAACEVIISGVLGAP